MLRALPSISLLATLLFVAARPALADVRVVKHPPTVEQKEIDPDNPPPEKKKFAPNHPAFTYCYFSANWHLRYDVEKDDAGNGLTAVRITLRSMEVTLDLHSTIWLPPDSDSKPRLLAHEKGHLKIGEMAYQGADRIARRIASEMMGNKFDAEGSDASSAAQAARDQAGKAFCDAYLKAVNESAQRVHDLYDQITNHGRNRNISPDDAVEQAIEQFKTERARKPTTNRAG